MEINQTTLDLLIQKGIVNQQQVNQAMQEAQKLGVTLEKAFEKLGFVTETEIAQVIAESLGVPYMDLTDYLVDPQVMDLIPEVVARKYIVVPLFKVGDTLTVAMENPHDIIALDDIRLKSGCSVVEAILSTKHMIEKVISQYYGVSGAVKEMIEEIRETSAGSPTDKKPIPVLPKIIEDAPVIKLVNLTIVEAVKERASDIHIEPTIDAVRIRYRIDGVLQESQLLPKHLQGSFISRIKVMAQMDISETRMPQDGRIRLKLEQRDLDLRVSTFPTINGENIVIRILDKSAVLLKLVELGFCQEDLVKFNQLIKKPNGIILVTGPTGAGKTTTLYAALATINSMEKNIITIEDPVEYEIPLVRQTQVNPKAGLTFANGLRSILRQDPDVVMVGEVRDKETAEIAIQASLTGHLVLSTLHTNDACGSLTRLIDMGIEPFLISSSVVGILAQRLVRLNCSVCKATYRPNEHILQRLKLPSDVQFLKGQGCSQCRQTGFQGRIGIFELLLLDDEIKKMILAKASGSDIKKKAISSGMTLLYDDGVRKIKQGMTTVEEVLRVTEEA